MTWHEERKLREEIVAIHRKLYELGFSVANDGNTSVRVAPDRVLITPAGLDKATLKVDQIATINMKGKPLRGTHPPSSEIALHLCVYRTRSDVNAIVHAHPPYSIACTLAGISLAEDYLPEVILTLGKIPTVPLVVPGTQEAGRVVSEYFQSHDAVIMERHGTVSVGKTLSEAMSKMERVEHTARIVSIAAAAMGKGKVPSLSAEDVNRLKDTHHKVDAPTKGSASTNKPLDPAVIDLIVQEVSRELLTK